MSDLFAFDGSYSSSPEDNDFLFTEFSPFSDSAIDILQALHNPEEPGKTEVVSPPSHELQNLSIYAAQAGSDFPLGDYFRVKAEQCQSGLEQFLFESQNLIQRSYSSNSFEQKPCSLSSSFSFSPRFDAIVEPQTIQNQAMSSPENGFFSGQMRRVCSTGDLQNYGSVQMSVSNNPLEEVNFKVGKYSAEERKERISKYRAKRTLRNFNKTIKYACRKTLADNRPRIRGRFARNDEPVVSGNDIPKAPSSSSSRPDDYDDDLWLEELHEEEEDTNEVLRGQSLINYDPTQFQYYGFSREEEEEETRKSFII